jgi:hypothetical protein
MKKLVLLLTIAAVVWGCGSSDSIPDTEENRRDQAQRYLKVTPPQDMMNDMVQNMGQNMSEAEREQFSAMMTEYVDMDSWGTIMTDAMVKHFTAQELKALADFYGSPVGKSAMSKFGAYMADVMPVIQQEMMKAYGKAMQAQKEEQDN